MSYELFNRPVIEKILSLKRLISNIRSAFTTTVYAFLIPSFHQLLGIFLPAIWLLQHVSIAFLSCTPAMWPGQIPTF